MPALLTVLLLPLATGLSFLYFIWVRAEAGKLEQALLISGTFVFALTLVLEKHFPDDTSNQTKHEEVLLAYLALSQPIVILQHANLPLRHVFFESCV